LPLRGLGTSVGAKFEMARPGAAKRKIDEG
jgi:hypothetical protein